MKCPKCRYVSFDYNEVCPKCNKDLTSERKKMNLPDYKPNPPFLLGALTGDLSDSGFGIKVGAVTDTGGVEIEDLEMHLDTKAPQEATKPSGAAEVLELDSQDSRTEIDLEEPSELQFEQKDKERLLKQEEEPDEDLSLDLGDLSLDEETPLVEATQEETSYGTSELVTSEIDKKKLGVSKDQEDSELELDLEESEDESS